MTTLAVQDAAAPVVDDSPRPTTSRAVWRLAGVMVIAAWLALLPLLGSGPVANGVDIPWWTLIIAFAAAEILVVHLTFGRNSVSFSLSEIPITLTFAAVAPLAALGIRLCGSLIGLVTQRVRGVKLAFNLASAALETVAATLVYRAVLGDGDPLEPRGWLAVLAAALIVDVISGLTITTAMALTEGRLDASAAPEIAISGFVAAATNSCLAVITLIVLSHDPRAGVALAVIAAIVLFAYRAWVVQARRFVHTEILFEMTRDADGVDPDGLAELALSQAKRLTGSAYAELAVFGAAGEVRRWNTEGTPGPAYPVASEDWWTGGSCTPTWAPSSSKDPAIRALLAELDRKDAMIAPLRSSRGTHGTILVADREDDVSTYTTADLKLLETLASLVAVELDNSQLVDRLRIEVADKAHLALHDPLTQLPNRRWFTSRVQHALDDGGPVSVLLLDLDRFKEINDALGHGAGDRVLCAVAARLSTALTGVGSVARLGGDEFAILLHCDLPDDVCATAQQLLVALQEPVEVDHLSVDLWASIGVAIAPLHGAEPETLVQHADVAMYFAKDHQSGVEQYSFERDVNDVRRLNLVTELRKATGDKTLHVFYQPQIDIRTNTIIGVEALARWTSEQYGPVGPDEFIPLAECTGLIAPLTDHVLATAIGDCATWRSRGWTGSVSVNLSARSLRDFDLPNRIGQLLSDARLPASALTLEITETSIMREPDRNIELLNRLDALGVRLAIDDFGTGYSSLSYLKRLPVKEVKIDKSFIATIDWDEGDQAIVKATIRLGHDLGLNVVAEGVETQGTHALLQQWGVDIAQGYYFGRPVAAPDIAPRLTRPNLTLAVAPEPETRVTASAG